MGRNYKLFLLGGIFFIATSFAVEPRNNHQNTTDKEPPKDNLKLDDSAREFIIRQNLIDATKKIDELPNADKGKPIARTESETVEKFVEKKAEAESRNRSAGVMKFNASEITDFPATEAKKAMNEVLKGNNLAEFIDYTKNYENLGEAVEALNNAGGLKAAGKVVSTQQTAALVMEKDQARLVYLAAAFKFHKDMMNATDPRNPVAETQEAINNSGTALGSSLAKGIPHSPTNQNTISAPDLSSLSAGYLDIAAKQIVNAGNNRPSDGTGLNLSSPFTAGTEINKQFETALNAANSLDLANKDIAQQLQPFKDLIKSKDFLENGALLLGKENAQTLISSVQAADLLNEASGKVTPEAAAYLSGAFNVGTGLSSPPCIACAEIKNSPLLKIAQEYSPVDEKVNEETQEWITEALELGDQASRNRKLAPKEVAALMKGRQELDKLMLNLDLYNSLGVLNQLKIPAQYSMSRHYKDAAEKAAAVLQNVIQKKIKNTALPSTQANLKKVKASAEKLYAQMKASKNPASMESVLRSFYEKGEHNEVRNHWRNYEMANYKKLRSLTAQIIMSRAFAALRLPSFEKVTLERASLGYLVNRAFSNLKERKERLLKEQQRNLGILQLPGIKMADEKEKEKMKPKSPQQEVERIPSFTDED